MQPTVVPPVLPQPQNEWREKYPCLVACLLTTFQAIIAIVIDGCEIGSILIDIVNGTIYVGLWAGIFFFIAWISQASASKWSYFQFVYHCFNSYFIDCGCRNHGYALYAMINQIVALLFSVCVIAFDAYFIVYPKTCFFSKTICNASGSSRGAYYSSDNFDYIKIPLIKAQLSAGAVMFVLCLVFISIYLGTACRVYRKKITPNIQPYNPYMANNPMFASSSLQPMIPAYAKPASSVDISCPGCNSYYTMGAYKPMMAYVWTSNWIFFFLNFSTLLTLFIRFWLENKNCKSNMIRSKFTCCKNFFIAKSF